MRVPLFIRVLPIYLLIGAVFVYPFWQKYDESGNAKLDSHIAQTELSTANVKNTDAKNNLISGIPDKIVIPSLGIDLPVVKGQYQAYLADWSVSPTSANYAVNTPEPNNLSGETYIYGHWSPQVFGPTQKLIPGDLSYVYTTNGHVFAYEYSSESVTTSSDTSVLSSFSNKPGLVLMTCQGTWAQDRRFMYFNFESAS